MPKKDDRGKPLSLDPLSYEEAVRDLLKVKPAPKQPRRQPQKKRPPKSS